MEPNAKLKKLEELLKIIDEGVTREEFTKATQSLVDFVKKNKETTVSELSAIKEALDSALERIKGEASQAGAMTKQEVTATVDEMMSRMMLEHEAMMAECDTKCLNHRDGIDGVDGEDGLDGADGKDGSPDTPEQVRDKLEKLRGEDRLSADAVKGLDAFIVKEVKSGGATRGFVLRVNGVKQGMVNELNIVGSGVAITTVNGLPTVTITGGSGATAVETPTGTVDGNNTAFTVSNTPLYIIVDGVSKFVTLHYTYLAGAITITDGAPPVQFIRSVYSA
jgi:hypothetical protein